MNYLTVSTGPKNYPDCSGPNSEISQGFFFNVPSISDYALDSFSVLQFPLDESRILTFAYFISSNNF